MTRKELGKFMSFGAFGEGCLCGQWRNRKSRLLSGSRGSRKSKS